MAELLSTHQQKSVAVKHADTSPGMVRDEVGAAGVVVTGPRV